MLITARKIGSVQLRDAKPKAIPKIKYENVPLVTLKFNFDEILAGIEEYISPPKSMYEPASNSKAPTDSPNHGKKLIALLVPNDIGMPIKLNTKIKPKVTSELLIGVTVGDIQKGNPYFGKVKGVTVLEIKRGSLAWVSGLRTNDVITSVNKNPVKNLEEFLSAVDKKNDSLLLRIVRGNMATFIVIKE